MLGIADDGNSWSSERIGGPKRGSGPDPVQLDLTAEIHDR